MSAARAAADSFNEIATARIEIEGSDPVIWREVDVPTPVTLRTLHDIVQALIGWCDYHLWQLTIAKRHFRLPMDEDGEPSPASMRARSSPATCSARARGRVKVGIQDGGARRAGIAESVNAMSKDRFEVNKRAVPSGRW